MEAFNIYLDLKNPKAGTINTNVRFATANNNAVTFHFFVMDGAEVVDLSEFSAAYIYFLKSDGKTTQNTGQILSDRIVCNLKSNDYNAVGIVKGQLHLKSESKTLAPMIFSFNAEQSINGAESVSQSQSDEFDKLIKKLSQMVEDFPNNNVVFSETRPVGGWRLWLQDLGEMPDYTFNTESETTFELEIAPLNTTGDFIIVGEDGNSETVTNMTDDPQTAKPDDIIVMEE